MGFRLVGEPIFLSTPEELVSSAVSVGTVQLLPDGQLILLMADHQTTGGYPRIAHVITNDLPLVAELGANDTIKFDLIEVGEAEDLRMRCERDLSFYESRVDFKRTPGKTKVVKIDLNCDVGEGYGNDAELMGLVTSANIACGYHAGDVETMRSTVATALDKGVAVGAHPGYPDREGFGAGQ